MKTARKYATVIGLMLLVGLLIESFSATAQDRERFAARQEAGIDNEALKLRLDALDRRMQNDATLVEERLQELHRRIRNMENRQPMPANPYLRTAPKRY